MKRVRDLQCGFRLRREPGIRLTWLWTLYRDPSCSLDHDPAVELLNIEQLKLGL